MPYKSESQRRYFNANKAKLEKEGVDVDEYNRSSAGKSLPEKVANPKPKPSKEVIEARKFKKFVRKHQ